jgi:GTP-binding protein HflX
VDQLIAQVAAKLTAGHRRYWITLPAGDGAGAAWLHAHGEVLGQEEEGEGLSTRYEVRLAERDYERFLQR